MTRGERLEREVDLLTVEIGRARGVTIAEAHRLLVAADRLERQLMVCLANAER